VPKTVIVTVAVTTFLFLDSTAGGTVENSFLSLFLKYPAGMLGFRKTSYNNQKK